MMRRSSIKNRIYLITIIIFMIFTSSFLTYYMTNKGEVYSSYKIKRIEEAQNQTSVICGNIISINMGIISPDTITIQAVDGQNQLIHSYQTISYFILVTILPFLQLYLQIKRRNILVSQTGIKMFMVHYLQLKDGKKSAQSF